MDFELAPEQKAQQQARQFAQQEVAPITREADEKGEFPLHLVKRMGELGFLAGPIDLIMADQAWTTSVMRSFARNLGESIPLYVVF